MTEIIVTCIIALFSLALGAAIARYQSLMKERSVRVILPKNTRELLFGIGMIVSVAAIVLCLNLVYDSSVIAAAKRIVLCSVLWPIALIDFRKHIIPNKILIVLLIIRAIILIPEFALDLQTAKKESISALIACFGTVILLCIMRLAVKNGIGFGDIKLFGVIGLYLGLQGIVTSVFLSFVVSFLVSVFLLASKRKSKKDQLALAPSILVGTILSVVFFGA